MSGEVLRYNRQAIKPSQPKLVAEEDRPEAEGAVPQTSSSSTSTDRATSTTTPATRSSSRNIRKPLQFQDYMC